MLLDIWPPYVLLSGGRFFLLPVSFSKFVITLVRLHRAFTSVDCELYTPYVACLFSQWDHPSVECIILRVDES